MKYFRGDRDKVLHEMHATVCHNRMEVYLYFYIQKYVYVCIYMHKMKIYSRFRFSAR